MAQDWMEEINLFLARLFNVVISDLSPNEIDKLLDMMDEFQGKVLLFKRRTYN